MIDLAFQRRVSERSALLAITLSLLLLALSGCGSDRRSAANTPSAPIARIEVSAGLTSESRTLSRPNAVMGRKYELITPTGERIMAAALQWQVDQEIRANAASYAQPAQCARNISKVLALAGLDRYQSPLVPQLVQQIRSNGGFVRRFPKSRQAIASLIATEFNGRLPTGALIAGCLYESCGGNAGDGHVAVVGDIDSNGALKVYHNNWYRPDNESGVWKPHMIPLEWYEAGYRRKFMSTPWMDILRDPPRVGAAYDVNIELPAIDDLDPTNYYVTIAVPVEIRQEIDKRQGLVLDRDGNQVPMGARP
jgi:hypothetical protein